jgi:glycosyltransferase involved in cell wall biosynthesis
VPRRAISENAAQNADTSGRGGGGTAGAGSTVGTVGGAVIVVMNLPVPDDHRVWVEARTLHEAGLRVTVVCPAIRDYRPGRRRIDGIDVVYFRSFEGAGKIGTIVEGAWTTFAASSAAKRALAGLRGAGPRSLQVCNPPDLTFGLLRWARRHGITTVYDQHDVVPLLASSRPSFRRLAPFFQYCERRTVAAADAVLTPSLEQVQRLQDLYGRTAIVVRTAAVAERKDATSDNAPTDTKPTDTALEEAAHKETVLGYLGVIGEQDGVGELLDAVHELRRRGREDFRVEIAGDGPALPEVRARAAELGLEDKVEFLGWIGRDQIDALLRRIDAMVVPDPDIEFNHYCAMNKVTHAMARGIPVVLRPLRENARLTGPAGIVAKDMGLPAFADAIETLLDADPAHRAEIGAQLRTAFDAELSWATSGPRYLSAFPTAAATSTAPLTPASAPEQPITES